MKTRWLLNIALLVVIAVLVSVVVLSPEDKPAEAPSLTTLKQSDVDRVDITRPNQPSILLEKSDGQWRMLEPYSVAANSFKVEAILGLLETGSFAQYDVKDLELANFGVDKPLAAVNINDALTIEFGNSEPISNRRYVRIGDTLHLINDTFYYQLGVKAHTFVDHGLLPTDAKLSEIVLPDFKLRFVTGAWIVEPRREKDYSDAATQLVDEWRNSQAISVAPYEKADVEKTVTVKFRYGPTVHFELRQTDNGLILARADTGLQYTVSKDVADRLLKLPELQDSVTPSTPATSSPEKTQ